MIASSSPQSPSPPPLTFVYISKRPGGIDLLASSLEDQVSSNFELIVVDDWPGRPARGKAREYVEKKRIPVRYWGPSKPHSLTNPPPKVGIANAMNTGLIHVRSPYVVFLQDYCYIPSDASQQWECIASSRIVGNQIATGIGRVFDAKRRPDVVDDIIAWNDKKPLNHATYKFDWIPKVFEMFYFGGPTERFVEMNGFDERADWNTCWVVSSFIAMAMLRDWSLLIYPHLTCHLLDHRVWADPVKTLVSDDLWRTNHLGNVRDEPEWMKESPNPYSMRELRRNVQ